MTVEHTLVKDATACPLANHDKLLVTDATGNGGEFGTLKIDTVR